MENAYRKYFVESKGKTCTIPTPKAQKSLQFFLGKKIVEYISLNTLVFIESVSQLFVGC